MRVCQRPLCTPSNHLPFSGFICPLTPQAGALYPSAPMPQPPPQPSWSIPGRNLKLWVGLRFLRPLET